MLGNLRALHYRLLDWLRVHPAALLHRLRAVLLHTLAVWSWVRLHPPVVLHLRYRRAAIILLGRLRVHPALLVLYV